MSNHFPIVISIMQLMNIVHQCAVSLTMSKAAKMTAIIRHAVTCSSCIFIQSSSNQTCFTWCTAQSNTQYMIYQFTTVTSTATTITPITNHANPGSPRNMSIPPFTLRLIPTTALYNKQVIIFAIIRFNEQRSFITAHQTHNSDT